MRHKERSISRRTQRRKERQVEAWQRIPQTRRDLMVRLAPMYQTASRVQKQLVLDEVVKETGDTRKSAIRLLNHPHERVPTIHRPCVSSYEPEVQRALFLAWKATHFVCAKRLMSSFPALVAELERCHHLRLTEEEHRQVQTTGLCCKNAERKTRDENILHTLALR